MWNLALGCPEPIQRNYKLSVTPITRGKLVTAPHPSQRRGLLREVHAAVEGVEAGVEVTLLLEPYTGWPGIPLLARLVESVNPAQGALTKLNA